MQRPFADSHLERAHVVTLVAAAVATAAAGVAVAAGAGAVARFVVSGIALAACAALIGQTIEQVGDRWGTGGTSLLQSTLGNLPELFVGIFALRSGLTSVVRAALVGSVLANVLLVLGFAFLVGGLRHGVQRFDPEEPRLNASLLLVVVAALLMPTLAYELGTPAARHAGTLSNICSIVLLVVYAASVPYSVVHTQRQMRERRSETPAAATSTGTRPGGGASTTTAPANGSESATTTPLPLTVAILTFASGAAALAAHWFVTPLEDATKSLGISETFAGLVIVAIASNAVEHVVGIRFALRAKPEYAVSTTLNSPLQVALLLTPVLVLVSGALGPAKLTLVFPPLLVAALAVSAIVVIAVVYDGEYTWVEGVALIGLYCIIVAGFWWG